MAASNSLEIEVKLRLPDLTAFANAGIVLTLVKPRHFEENWLLDAADKPLSAQLATLRIRAVSTNGQAGQGTVTMKAQPPAGTVQTQFKARIEIETGVNEPANLLQIFERLGYRPWFRYQKWRTVYQAALPNAQTLELMFDETPLGNFVELEGTEAAISQAVALLGISSTQFINESYLALQQAACRAQGQPLADLLFAGTT